jgi:hypothetical protein
VPEGNSNLLSVYSDLGCFIELGWQKKKRTLNFDMVAGIFLV